MRVAVVGAGVIGMTSALAVKTNFPQFEVHVYADQFSPDTTGDGSAGLWMPYLLGHTPGHKISRWAGSTHRWFEELWKAGLASETGLSLIPFYYVTTDATCNSKSWMNLVYGAHRLRPNELESINAQHNTDYKDGWNFLTYTAEPVYLLPWLTRKFEEAGGKLWKRKIRELRELIDEGYDLIINCSGLGARELVGDDTVVPIRGQVARVAASWVFHGILEQHDHGSYIIPNMESVILGGTRQENDYDRVPREEDSKFIRENCCRILPALKNARVLKEWVGLRPGRPEVRIEAEAYKSSEGRRVKVIHNYGHGGSGVTLCWGCALDVVEIIRNMQNTKSRFNKRPLMVVRGEIELGETKKTCDRPDGELSSESDSSTEVRSCKTVYRSRSKKLVVSDNASLVPFTDFIKNDPIVSAKREDKADSSFVDTDVELRKDGAVSRRKKKKRRYLTICTSNCKYEAVRRVAARFGMKEVTEDSSWNLYWTDLSVSVERAKDMKRYQKVNHFPGMTEICRKDLLARNLNRMLKLFPKDYNFFPKTWCFPADHGEAMAYAKLRRSKTFIIKPDTGCQGRGIYLTRNLKDVKPSERMICQVYVARPFLVDGYKFDLRIYALITSCDPLRIYIYNDGLARFATSRYKEPTGHNTSNVFMHLTNYAVNKHSRMYVIDDEIGSKRKISTLNKWFKMKDVDVDELWRKIDEIIIKTVLAAYPILKHSYHTCFPTHDKTYACFELLGFDVLLDWKLKPYLLEVNHSPSFHTDAQIDKDIKEGLLMNTFDMLNLQQCDKKKIIEEDRKRVRDRLLQGINTKDGSVNDSTIGTAKPDKPEEDYLQKQFKWEDEHMGNFRRIYPCTDIEKYEPFFKQTGISVYQDTAASRAREEAARVQKEENDTRVKEQENRKIVGKWSDFRLHPESPNCVLQKPVMNDQERSKSASFAKRSSPPSNTKKHTPANGTLNSFEPEIISESEERERVTALAQRDFLIKSYGMLEQIYMAMKKNGTLRAVDEKKYGLYERLGYAESMSKSASMCRHKCYIHQNSGPETRYEPWTSHSSQFCLKASKADNRMYRESNVGEPMLKRVFSLRFSHRVKSRTMNLYLRV
ncbi:tubulin polyglutamylase TTLL13-like [Ceratina calcarata]|uniref:Tubulin polyglutamylase TTLL13-like n=1 Tax=Ceratina calcarata TaxID=156304 RepID=A0AAJ7IX98_9HYME|nr:tubulin polyglutamylase TTLL13-like [Ceratina calcarata]